jgi:hypothetical protein
MVLIFLLANDAQAQKISAFPVHEAERTDNFIIYRPSGVPVTNLRFNVDSIFSLLTVGDISGLDTTGLWESDGTNVWWLGGNIGADIATPATLFHLGQADGADPDYGTKARGLQWGQSPLGRLNAYQNTSNELQFTVDDVNKFKMSTTGLNMQSDILPVTTNLYDLGSPTLNFDTLYTRDIYIDDSLMTDYIVARLPAPAAAGNENEIQFNTSGALDASSNFAWNDTTLNIKSSVGTYNLFVGNKSGEIISTGNYNTFLGVESGKANTQGFYNTFIGEQTGNANATGDYNVYIGAESGFLNTSNNNVMIGYRSGLNNISGTGNIFLGYLSGQNETGSNKLYIENTNSSTPLIYGEFDNNYVEINDSLKVSKALKFGGNSNENYSQGKLYYDTTDQALTFFNDQSEFKWQISREIPVRFYNNSGSTIDDGVVIRSVGAKINGSITFKADIAGNGSLDSLQGVALTTVSTPPGEFGEATIVGQVNNLNTSAFNDNDLLYIGCNGTLTNVNPEPPKISAIVARVVYADNDSGAIYFFPVGEAVYRPNPTFTARFEDSTEVITNPGLGAYELITSATGTLFGEARNVGFTFQGDSISPKQDGNYTIFFSYSFQGTAAQTDLYRIGVFIDGVKQYSTSRTASGANNGGVPFPYSAYLTAGQWINFRVANLTDGVRNCTFTDGTITINYSE